MKKLFIPLGAFVIIGAVACTSYAKTIGSYKINNQQIDIAKKKWPDSDAIKLDNGKQIFTNQCTECHKAFVIEKFSETKWKHEIDDMSPKAKLTELQKTELTYFILSYLEMKQAPK
jgi:hypothetical protein